MKKLAKLEYAGLRNTAVQIKLKKTGDLLDELGLYASRKAQQQLTRGGKDATGNLGRSYKSDHKVKGDDIVLYLYGLDYGMFVDKGVKGLQVDRAPDSPFRFGSGTGPAGGLRPAIRQWILDKPVPNDTWRDKSGRFLSYDQMAAKIARSVFLKGIVPFPHIEDALNAALKQYAKPLSVAIMDDFAVFMNSKDYHTDFEINLTF